jgi:2-C-methyl-D-erythritol 4-phosphate cytidylyltransferase
VNFPIEKVFKQEDANNPCVWGVIPAGGTGQRYSQNENKLLLSLLGQPVLWWSVNAFLETPCIEGVVIAAHPNALEIYQQVLSDLIQAKGKPILWASGGETRRDSVYSALCALQDSSHLTSGQAVVSVHDAARPLITPQDIEKSLRPLISTKTKQPIQPAGTVLGKAMMDTLKRIKTEGALQEIGETVNRDEHWAAQTPQNFPLSVLIKAHQAISPDALITDDAQLVELAQLGMVLAIEADDENLKLTRPQDLAFCEWVLSQRHPELKTLSSVKSSF